MRATIAIVQRCTVGLLAALVVCTAAKPSPAQPATASSTVDRDDNVRVRALYREGVALYEAGKFQDARRTLLEAWAIRHTYDIASSLAQVEMELKLYPDAAAHLAFCLQNIPPAESEATLKQFQQGLAETKSHVGEVTIAANRDGADVFLDGQAVGKTPLPGPLYVQPGLHRIEIQLNNERATTSFDVGSGKTHQANLTLRAAQVTEPSQTPSAFGTTPVEQNNDKTRPSLVPVIIGGAVLAVGVGAAIGFAYAAHSNEEDAKKLAASNGLYGCGNGQALPGDCRAQDDALHREDRYRNLSTAGIVTAAVAAVAIPVYWFWPRTKPSGTTSTVRMNPSVGRHQYTLSISADF